jgi:hypothetical protein
MADVRFLILVGPPSLDPTRMGFPPQEPVETQPPVLVPGTQNRTSRTTGRRRPPVTGELMGASAYGWYAWRLMASNNRRLASSIASFASRPFVVDAITQLKTDLATLKPHVLTNPHNGSWGWRVERDGVPVAVCPHWYERERDCRSGVARFVDAVPRAQIAEGGMMLRDRHGPASGTLTIRGMRR